MSPPRQLTRPPLIGTLDAMATAPVSPAPASARPARWTPQPLPAAAAQDHAGKLFAGRYLMRRRIGGGGMSTIHEALDTTLGIRVAVKIMRSDLPSDPVDRFRREAHVLAQLAHEHIARILDRQDPEDGPRFLVTEYIDGVDLGRLRHRGPLPAAVVHQIALQVSAALAVVHAEGVIHRDINPANLMLVRHPSGDIFVKIIDFGIAKLERGADIAAPENAPPGARRATLGDVVLGTPPYYRGHDGPRRDVYALALTLAELLTGRPPEIATDLSTTAIPEALAQVLMTALHSDDLASMNGLHAALREADVQPEADAEVERRRYAARAFASEPKNQPDKPPAETPPEKFASRYILCEALGQGGMGLVRVAFDTETRRRVALKTIHPRCAGMKNLEHRFRREGRALAAIEHSGTPRLFESGTVPEPYFTMEIVEGVTLAATLKHGKIDPQRALNLAIDLGEILQAAHEVGVVHRDVKPANILISHGDRVRLIDFGACLLTPRFHQRHLLFPATPAEERYATGELEAVGTPGYSAPEILRMEGGSGPRSDIYSLCAVLYEMLTGRPLVDPATGETRTIDRGEFATALGPIAELLRRGTASDPNERVWSMADLVRCLAILRTKLLRAREHRRLAFAAAASVASTAALITLALHPWSPSPPAITSTVDPPAAPATHAAAAPISVTNTTAPHASLTHRAAPPAMAPPPAAPLPKGVGASGSDPVPSSGPSQIFPPSNRSSRPLPVNLTEATVAARLATRAPRLKAKCALTWIDLDLTIRRGRAALVAVNGMPFAENDPIHTCVREQLRGLAFPPAGSPATFSLTIDLNRPPSKEPQ